jgi:hypothetical protein
MPTINGLRDFWHFCRKRGNSSGMQNYLKFRSNLISFRSPRLLMAQHASIDQFETVYHLSAALRVGQHQNPNATFNPLMRNRN